MQNKIEEKITYNKLFWLFLIGSLAGVILEGSFCLIYKGHWENHVVSVLGYFNILYGLAAVLFYVTAYFLRRKSIFIKVIVLMILATLLEFVCGLALRNELGMRAWNYENSFLNYKGIICAGFSLAWGGAGFLFCMLYPIINSFLYRLSGKIFQIACFVLTVFLIFNLSLTAAAIIRWSERHRGISADTGIEEEIDKKMPDEWMQSRFIEWEFLDGK